MHFFRSRLESQIWALVNACLVRWSTIQMLTSIWPRPRSSLQFNQPAKINIIWPLTKYRVTRTTPCTDGMTVLSALKMKASAEFEVQVYLRTVWSYENMQIIKNKALWAVWWTVCFKIRGFQIFKIDFGVFFKCLTTKYLQNAFKYRGYLRLTKGTSSLIPVNYINMKNGELGRFTLDFKSYEIQNFTQSDDRDAD